MATHDQLTGCHITNTLDPTKDTPAVSYRLLRADGSVASQGPLAKFKTVNVSCSSSDVIEVTVGDDKLLTPLSAAPVVPKDTTKLSLTVVKGGNVPVDDYSIVLKGALASGGTNPLRPPPGAKMCSLKNGTDASMSVVQSQSEAFTPSTLDPAPVSSFNLASQGVRDVQCFDDSVFTVQTDRGPVKVPASMRGQKTLDSGYILVVNELSPGAIGLSVSKPISKPKTAKTATIVIIVVVILVVLAIVIGLAVGLKKKPAAPQQSSDQGNAGSSSSSL